MTPDRSKLTRAESIRLRREQEQQTHGPSTDTRAQTSSAPTPVIRQRTANTAERQKNPGLGTTPAQYRYRSTVSTPYTRSKSGSGLGLHLPQVILPPINFGYRWLSLLVGIFCIIAAVLILNSDPFIVRSAEISGNLRIPAEEIQEKSGIIDLASALINPTQVEQKILTEFPDIKTAHISVDLPSRVQISIEERAPVISWNMGDKKVWIDSDGIAFQPRGEINPLLNITAKGEPPAPVIDDSSTGQKLFLTKEMFTTINTLKSFLPENTEVIFDPEYGLGWNDPQGWQVYFGNTDKDSALKLEVYKKLLTYLDKNNIKPIMISVVYPNAPFYRVEQ